MKRSRSHLSVVVEEVARRDVSLFPRYVPDQMRQLSARSDKIPSSFEASWNALMAYRSVNVAPVDTMGCERLFQQDAPPNAQRYQVLLSLLLSPQSKDEKTKESIDNLIAAVAPEVLTPEKLLQIPDERLQELIRPSGMYRAKARALREVRNKKSEKVCVYVCVCVFFFLFDHHHY